MIAVSIVSHGHGEMVQSLVSQLRECPEVTQVVITRNIPEASLFFADDLVQIDDNPIPKGFGANHNSAFRLCRTSYFCVLNPDIQLQRNPFPTLLDCLEKQNAALAAPLIISPSGAVEDSVRRFPTAYSLLLKAIGGPDGSYLIKEGQPPVFPDWVAGMFMLFKARDFDHVDGFDERYFLYYEDVDICRRISRAGMKIVACPSVIAIHNARRASHRNIRHLRWHLASMVRFLWTAR